MELYIEGKDLQACVARVKQSYPHLTAGQLLYSLWSVGYNLNQAIEFLSAQKNLSYEIVLKQFHEEIKERGNEMSDVKELLQKVTESNSMVADEEWLTQIALAYDNMEPIALAMQLKEALDDPMLVAMALRKVIVKYPAVVVGGLLLNDQMYPELSREEMKNILNNAFPKENLERAISILYPLNFEVEANKIWNDTGIDVFPDEIVKIRYLTGRWSVSPSSGWCVALGRPPIGKMGYTLFGQFEGCLVGRIGDTEDDTIPNFYVGQSYSGSGLGTEKGSRLYLAANDDVKCRYGKGFTDNTGSLIVEITKELI